MSSALPDLQLGPDKSDLRSARPYFVLPVPILTRTDNGSVARAEKDRDYVGSMARIKDAVAAAGKPFSDVYVLSHGWHRNYFSGVSSYDRLISRTLRLQMRGRLPVPDNYNPLFLCIHWSSDPGKDAWTDLSGRRDKTDFLRIAKERFQMSVPLSQNTLEDAFELFSALSAPDTKVDDTLNKTSAELGLAFKRMRLAEEPATSDDETMHAARVAAAWSCYDEAIAKGVRGVQDNPPRPFAGLLLRLTLLLKFIVGAAGIGAVLGQPLVKHYAALPLTWIAKLYFGIHSWFLPLTNKYVAVAAAGFSTYAAISLLAFVLFALFIAITLAFKKGGFRSGIGWFTGVFWLITEVAFALPLIVLLLLEYVVVWPALHMWLFSERRKESNRFNFSLNYWLAGLARWPNRILRKVEDPESFWDGLSRAFDNQLAFFDMQRRGVNSGFVVAKSLVEILKSPKFPNEMRLHIVGHSFGGLLVVNVARELARAKENGWGQDRSIHTLCAIEGAFASAWFKKESNTVNHVTSTLATIFSEADSANGFYYPAANAGRMAAGSVGFSKIKDDGTESDLPQADVHIPCRGGCTCNHVHRPLPYASLADPPVLPGLADGRSIVNIDASKMIYEGAVASGGGHTDIYKDDVICLLWAVLHRQHMIQLYPPKPPRKPANPTPKNGSGSDLRDRDDSRLAAVP